jgi:hypothetical protein
MEHLASLLAPRDISFDASDRLVMCYGHIVDLCSGRVISSLDAVGGDGSSSSSSDGSEEPSTYHPISLGRAVVRAIRGSGLRREAFQEVIENGNAKGWFKEGGKIVQVKPLQLLQDVQTRWDSVFHMLSRLREMRPVRLLC